MRGDLRVCVGGCAPINIYGSQNLGGGGAGYATDHYSISSMLVKLMQLLVEVPNSFTWTQITAWNWLKSSAFIWSFIRTVIDRWSHRK